MSVENTVMVGTLIPSNKLAGSAMFVPEMTLYMGNFTYGKYGEDFLGLFDKEADFKVFTQGADDSVLTEDGYGNPPTWTTPSRIIGWYQDEGRKMKNPYAEILNTALKNLQKIDDGYVVVNYLF